jgi:hypothetical protein
MRISPACPCLPVGRGRQEMLCSEVCYALHGPVIVEWKYTKNHSIQLVNPLTYYEMEGIRAV